MLENRVSIFGKLVDGIYLIEKLRTIPIDRKSKEPMINIYIKSTLVIDDPFPEYEEHFFELPSPKLPKVN